MGIIGIYTVRYSDSFLSLEIQDIRVLLISLLAEFFLGIFSIVKVYNTVDFLKISEYCLAVFVQHKLVAVAYGELCRADFSSLGTLPVPFLFSPNLRVLFCTIPQ